MKYNNKTIEQLAFAGDCYRSLTRVTGGQSSPKSYGEYLNVTRKRGKKK